MKLSSIILEADYWERFKPQAKELEYELQDTFNRNDIMVTIIAHSNGDKAMGKVQVKTDTELTNSEYLSLKNTLSAKGYDVTGGANYADNDGDRKYYPDVKFEFKI